MSNGNVAEMPMQDNGMVEVPYRHRGLGRVAGAGQTTPADLTIPVAVEAVEKMIGEVEGSVYGLEEKLYPVLQDTNETASKTLNGETTQSSKVIQRLIDAVQRLQNLSSKVRNIQGRVQL